jgi:hypothetical protein
MPISNNILAIIDDVVNNDPTNALENRISWEAVQAILAGIHSEEWRTYMSNFIDAGDENQLRRLTFQDSAAEDPVIRKTLVYLAAMAICTGDTFAMLTDYINPTVLDQTLACPPPEPDRPAPDNA